MVRSALMPETVREFLGSLDRRNRTFRRAREAVLVEWEDESLVLEIASDDATSKYCYHAGGNRLVVPKEQLAAFRRALKNRGYIMPAGK